ncbi:hypothetical protein KUCAC02_020617, partial [Chaenocephalus aceratus]
FTRRFASSEGQTTRGLQAFGSVRMNLHLSVWLHGSNDRYQALVLQQNDIAAFDPTPKLISVHFGGFYNPGD